MAPPPEPRESAAVQALNFLRFLGKLAVLLAGLFAFGLLVFWLRRSI